MDMTGEYRIAAPRERVWAALNDTEVLRQAIPGCEEIEKTSETEMTAKVTAKVGPVKAKFGGKVTLSDIDPPNGYTISGEGTGGAAGFAKGGARVKLADDPDGTLLSYTVNASVGGKLAQIGSRLIDGTARKMADEFFGKFAEIVTAQAAETAPAEAVALVEPTPVAIEPVLTPPEPAVETAAETTPAPAAVAEAAAAAPEAPMPAMDMPAIDGPGEAADLVLAAATPGASMPSATPETTGSRGLPPLVWITLLILVVAGLLWYFAG